MRFRFRSLLLIILLLCSAVLSLMSGPVKISFFEICKTLFNSGTENDLVKSVLLSIRLPRIVAAGIAGWSLALAGLCYQSLLKNPLASEYTLGIATGAALGALFAALLRMHAPVWTPLFAFLGSIATMILVFAIARSGFIFENYSLVLTGIILNAFGNALLSLILSILSPNQLHSFLFWFLGSFASVQWHAIAFALPVVALVTLVILSMSRAMNAIAVNEELAHQVGIPILKIKIVLFLSSGLLTAVVVSFAGTIGFIGLVVPHFGRMLSGSDNTRLVWIVPFLGATLCILADLLARTVLSPAELPVGVITAFLGVPVFLYFMARSRLHAAG